MKIQCDVCSKESASVFCPSDEAVLCHGCDHRVHHANKLAGKHTRYSLQHPSESPPKCDICQDKRAFLFCQEDRAILCRGCDLTIHRTNQHTQKHNRFLLTGIKLSEASSSSENRDDDDGSVSNSNIVTSEQADYFMEGGGGGGGWDQSLDFHNYHNNNNNNGFSNNSDALPFLAGQQDNIGGAGGGSNNNNYHHYQNNFFY